MRGIPRRAVAARLPVADTDFRAEIADTDSVRGVDFIRADDTLFPYHEREIAACAQAIVRSGRPIELSLSPGPDVSVAHLDHLRENATM
jgi:hypothetical protein